jgi:hypothetical protein
MGMGSVGPVREVAGLYCGFVRYLTCVRHGILGGGWTGGVRGRTKTTG